MSELTKRVLFAIPAAAVMLYISWLGGLAFELFFGAITLLTILEIHRIFRYMKLSDFFPLSAAVALVTWFFTDLPVWLVYTLTGFSILISVLAYANYAHNISRKWFASLFNGIYAPVGFFMIVAIRNLGSSVEGFWLVLTFFFMIWGNDVFAYFGGKKFGKRKLAPNISPNKTLEGFWFGFAGAATGFLIVFFISNSFPLSIWSIIPSVLIIGFLGPAGDIMESSLKRLAGVKDSSSIFPGHGGFFDRFDSMIMTAPFIYFLFCFII